MPKTVENVTLKPVEFESVKITGFFKESKDCSTWYMKTSTNHAEYQSNGVRGDCRFEPKETVFVEVS